MNKIIALDIGGVCTQLRHPLAYEFFKLNPEHGLPPQLLHAIDALERGLADESQLITAFRDFAGDGLSDSEIIHGWNLIIGDDMPGMRELLSDITAMDFKFVFFSDTSTTHMNRFFRHSQLTHLVSDAVFSYQVHAKKPEAPMYEYFEQRHGKPCLYIDDRADNIAAGLARGWDCHRFESAASLRDSFMKKFDTPLILTLPGLS